MGTGRSDHAMDERARTGRERRRMAAVTAAAAGGLISLTVALLGANSSAPASAATPTVHRPAQVSGVTAGTTNQRR
ncbi:hypothetical protein [Fodinicola acaciae]|uniref:hypothetical protein n=1 Tax=Fodinicola acaciae TaxID=2681555 RepID=UPI0013D4CE90|nr:hypothetical protein [Fodinicola acaciae]